jgi:hypothetical protein
VKEFVLNYLRYRRLGFDQLEAIDLSLSRPSSRPVVAGAAPAPAARVQLRIVKCSSPAALAGNATAPVSREWGAPHVTAAGIDVANKAFSPGFLPGPRSTGDATSITKKGR